MNSDDRKALESKKFMLRLFIVLLGVAFFAYIIFVRPALRAAF